MRDYRVLSLLRGDNSYDDSVPSLLALVPVLSTKYLIERNLQTECRKAYEAGVEVGFDAGVQHAQSDLLKIWHPEFSDPILLEFREKLIALHMEYGVRLQYHTGQGLGIVKY